MHEERGDALMHGRHTGGNTRPIQLTRAKMSSTTPPSPTSITRRTSTNHHYTDSPEQNNDSDLFPAEGNMSSHDEETHLQITPTEIENTHKSISGTEATIRFLLLHSQIFIVLLLEFLNSFRSFGLRFVLYNYITNEFGISDSKTGILMGIKGFVDIGFGLAGSILVDIVGVRRTSLVALGVALVGRTLLAFGRTKGALYPALFVFSPCGDALLSSGLYAVALKKLTTPLTRPLAFAISYATFNLAGAFADIILDKMRASVDDYSGIGGVYTPVRQFIVLTWLVLVITFLIAFFYLRDLSVIDPDDLDSQSTDDMDNVEGTDSILNDAMPARPMVELRTLKRWFPNQQIFHPDEDGVDLGNSSQLPNYQVYKTKYSSGSTSAQRSGAIYVFFSQVMSILRLRSTWIVLIFGFLTMTVSMNWSASEIVLPAFLERRFGESIPIYTIQSVNLIMCLILPPFVASLTSDREVFEVMMPGLWLMAISPIFVAVSPNVLGACLWQIVMTLGEVLWSPRSSSWTADLAPTGKEGLFFAVSSARAVLGPLSDFVLGAMNEKWNTNCIDCRDQYGHFCSIASESDELQCTSSQETCQLFLDNSSQTCPSTCMECPTWKPTNPSTLWYILMVFGILSPLSVWCFLPFLRARHKREDKFYGLLSFGKYRLLGVCGVQDNDHRSFSKQYNHVIDRESFDISTETQRQGKDAELL